MMTLLPIDAQQKLGTDKAQPGNAGQNSETPQRVVGYRMLADRVVSSRNPLFGKKDLPDLQTPGPECACGA